MTMFAGGEFPVVEQARPWLLRWSMMAVLCAACAPSERTANAGFGIDGVVTQQNLAPSPRDTLPATFQTPFRLVVVGDQWRIDLPECSKHPDSFSTYHFDGQWLYVLHSFPEIVARDRDAGKNGPGNVAAARMQGVPFPRELPTPEATLAWLTYCSSSQFDGVAVGKFPPVFAYGGTRVHDGTSTAEPQLSDWALTDTAPLLPTRFVSLGVIPSQMLQAMEAASGTAPGSLSAVFTNVVFGVESVTNLGGLVLPLKATAVLLKPTLAGDHITSLPVLEMVLQATNVSAQVETGVSLPPTLTGPTTIADDRFGVGSVSFPNRTNWVGESETTNSPQFERLKLNANSQQRASKASPPTRYVVRTALAVSAVGLLVALLLFRQLPSAGANKNPEDEKGRAR